MIDPVDLEACREAIRHGSVSFHAASKLLPGKVRDPALALYAFCRVADDEVDLTNDKRRAVDGLRDRLAWVYEGRPRNAPSDRASNLDRMLRIVRRIDQSNDDEIEVVRLENASAAEIIRTLPSLTIPICWLVSMNSRLSPNLSIRSTPSVNLSVRNWAP